jgi:outer membrane protein OmpA-like peptidoglycan-associated protein
MSRILKTHSIVIVVFVFVFQIATGQDSIPAQGITPAWEITFKLSPMLTRLKSDQYKAEEKGKPTLSFGSDIAYYFIRSQQWKVGVSVGLGIGFYKTNRQLNYNDSAWGVDPLGEQVHIFEQGRFTETQKAAHITVPVSLLLKRAISERMEIYLNTGYYRAWTLSGSYATSGIMSRQGYYPKYNALVYDVDVYGSQLYYPENKSISESKSLSLKNSGGIVASLGVTYRLTPKICLFGGLTSCFGLSNVSGYNKEGDFTLINNDQSLNTLMRRGDKIKANAYGAELGVSFRFGGSKKQLIAEEPPYPEPPQTILPEETPTAADTIPEATPAAVHAEASKTETEVKEPTNSDVETSPDTTKVTPQIEGKDDITQVQGPIELAFTDNDSNIVNPPVNYNPRRVYTLDEVNRLLQQGVSLKKKYTVLQRIEFEFNTDNLLENSKQYLDQLVTFMQLQPQCNVRIIGHTDDAGSKAYNQTLSEKRAGSVMNYLISKGIDKKRLSSAGYGSSKPIDKSQTPEGNEKNRRVEFEINWL